MRALYLAIVAALCGTLSCTEADDSSNTVAIGLLLPFSGSQAATSANFERAAIFAVNQANAAGGIRGKRLRLVAADTHSSQAYSLQSVKRLVNEDVAVVIGMESSGIATALLPVLSEHDTTLLSPFVGTADDALVNCSDTWFRLAPAAHALGEALAKELAAQDVPSVVVLTEPDAFSQAFGDAFTNRFTSLEGTVVLDQYLDPDALSYGEVFYSVVGTEVTDVVLASSARTASVVITEFQASPTAPFRWHLSPLLKTPALIRNVGPEALNGAQGVTPRIYETRSAFSQAFQDRWDGELPLEGAHFYYDAVAVTAYTLQDSLPVGGGVLSADAFKQSVFDVTTPFGEPTGWDDLQRGLEGLDAGRRVYYAGVTGPILFDQCGARRIGTYSTWRVRNGQIMDSSSP